MTNYNKKVTLQLTCIDHDCQTSNVGANLGSGSSKKFSSSKNTSSSSSKFGSLSDNGDEAMKWIAHQVKGLQTAISVPLLQVVRSFEGDSSQFKEWVKEIEKYAHMARLDNTDIPRIVLMTCKGTVGDFVKRYLEEIESEGEIPDWTNLKRLMQKRYAEITDNQRAMTELRKIKQTPEESVQLYSERLLRLAEDAYTAPFDETEYAFIQKQLVDIFCDGLFYDYLRMRVLRCDPRGYDEAVEIAMKEQNLRKRFNLRSNTQNETLTNDENSDLAVNSSNQKCFKCNCKGHTVWECPQRVNKQNIKPVLDYSDPESDENREVSSTKRKKSLDECENTIPNKQKLINTVPVKNSEDSRHKILGQTKSDHTNRHKTGECWLCHAKGHFRRNCPNRRFPDRYRVRYYSRDRYLSHKQNQGNFKALFKRKPLKRADKILK
ncbi:hypothetical protein FSP39_018195 [Pinctada imbricata]|uniref:CCHC-type domain-containing protein n=1 Tax=Pinctada imbricata TaxID=66713 RepID=A0AA88YVM4_PINIB|nr:hypothetical protein FSP39_018195 [Pinctada imbricata]